MDNDALIASARSVPIEDEIIRRGIKLRKSGAERIGPCPKCGGTDRFSINNSKGVFNCRGCGHGGDVIELVEFLDGVDFKAAVETLAGTPLKPKPNGNAAGHHRSKPQLGPIVATYNYEDKSGAPLFQVTRHEPKDFRQRRPDGNGGWIDSTVGVLMVPYHLPEIDEAIGQDQIIFIVEGEKDADNLRALGLWATCNPRGAGKWANCKIDSYFRDAHIVIIGDNDPQSINKKSELMFHDDGRPRFIGWDHAQEVAVHLFEVAADVRVVDLKKFWLDCPNKGDITDWIIAQLNKIWPECPRQGQVSEWLADREKFSTIISAVSDQLSQIVDETDYWQPRDELKAPFGYAQSRVLILSSAEFVRLFVPPDYLIYGILQRRFLYAFTGRTGSGKTAIVLLIAASIALGKAIGDLNVERGRVLYLAGENPDDVRMRWIAMSKELDFDVTTIEVFFIPGRFKISEMRQHIINELQQIGEIALLIVDTSAVFYEGKEVNSNTEQAAHAQLMRTLLNLPGGPCVLVNCHPVKNASPDNMLPLGAGAFLNEIDGNLTCIVDGPAVEVYWQGKFRGPDFEPLSFKIVSGVTHERLVDSKGNKIPTVIAEPLSETAREELSKEMQTKADQLLLEIDKNNNGSVAQFAERCGWRSAKGKPQKSTVYRLIVALKKDKLIVEELGGFTITKTGKKHVTKLTGADTEKPAVKRNAGKTACCAHCYQGHNDAPVMIISFGKHPETPLHEKCAEAYYKRFNQSSSNI